MNFATKVRGPFTMKESDAPPLVDDSPSIQPLKAKPGLAVAVRLTDLSKPSLKLSFTEPRSEMKYTAEASGKNADTQQHTN